MVRPVALAQRKVDVIIGNPPWLNYRNTISDLRSGLERLSKDIYGIWEGGRYATHMDVAGLFYTRSVDLYLKDDGVIGMVLPHSALQSGQYSKWRTGRWKVVRDGAVLSADFSFKPAWDLERIEPNTFFPIPASVVFVRRVGVVKGAQPLAGTVEQWIGQEGAENIDRVSVAIVDTSEVGESPYGQHAEQGAILVPRSLVFVEETTSSAVIRAGGTIVVNPRRGSQDKIPWKGLDLTDITGQTIETAHVYEVYLNETLVPYATLDPLKAVLPIRRGDGMIAKDTHAEGGVKASGLERRMRERWHIISRLWEVNKAAANKLNMIEQLDYWRHMTSQMEWQRNNSGRPLRIIHSEAGIPTASLVGNSQAFIDSGVYWLSCENMSEANYLLAIINSETSYEAVMPLMAKGQFGARHLHKHMWKLPIPEYDEGVQLHRDLTTAGEAAAAGVQVVLAKLREERGDKLTVTIARREIRKWLRESKEGKAVERLVGELLGGR